MSCPILDKQSASYLRVLLLQPRQYSSVSLNALIMPIHYKSFEEFSERKPDIRIVTVLVWLAQPSLANYKIEDSYRLFYIWISLSVF